MLLSRLSPPLALQRAIPRAYASSFCSSSSSNQSSSSSSATLQLAGLLAAIGATAGVASPAWSDGAPASLPLYSLKEVAKHDGKTPESGGRVWVTKGDAVYDITQFISSHPGGAAKISLAAGKSLEPFWTLFPFHFELGQVTDILKGMQIGTLDPADVAAVAKAKAEAALSDPFAKDPARHPALKLHSTRPCNGEVPAELLTESYITPAELFYIRHHHPVPDADKSAYRLAVDAISAGGDRIELTLEDLRSLPQHEIVATLQCSGNRRSEMNKVKKSSGTSWGQGAISTAVWSGPRLVDVLELAGIQGASAAKVGKRAKHACFSALDSMAASVPVSKALNPSGDVILALEMNHKPLNREHGAPVRAIVPGFVGVRNVKWVKEVKLSEEEAVGDWQRGLNYKVLPPGLESGSGVDISKIPAMQEASVFSGITAVEDAGERKVDAKGWAWSGGGRGIARVDVSTDGGATWHAAKVTEGGDQALGREWAWVFWEASDMPVKAEAGSTIEVVSRAVDKAYNVQPEKAAHIWNMRGLGNNSWYRASVDLED